MEKEEEEEKHLQDILTAQVGIQFFCSVFMSEVTRPITSPPLTRSAYLLYKQVPTMRYRT